MTTVYLYNNLKAEKTSHDIPGGMTLDEFLRVQVDIGAFEDVIVRHRPAGSTVSEEWTRGTPGPILRDGDRVSVTPRKIQGA